jgi:hypothetical protein
VSERQRKLAFASAALLLLAITGLLVLREPGLAPGRGAQPQRPASTAIRTGPAPFEPSDAQGSEGTTQRSSPAPATRSSTAAAQREREARRAPAVAPGDARAAAAAARAFLDGYLPYSYGHAEARRIRAAARPLLRELASSPPRVPATVARGRPRLIAVRAQAATGDLSIDVLAVVDDGQRRYSIPLSVCTAGGRWVVSAVNG